MSALPQYLARGTTVRNSTRVTAATRVRDRWRVSTTARGELGQYDVLLISTPPAQAVPLLTEAPALQEQAGGVSMRPCWTVMAAFASVIRVPWQSALVVDGSLDKVTRNRAKPGRPDAETWVFHAKGGWTAQNIDLRPEEVIEEILSDFEIAAGSRLPAARFVAAHLWRYARPASPLSSAFLWDDDLRIGVCGDWCKGTDIESAFLSGLELAEAVTR